MTAKESRIIYDTIHGSLRFDGIFYELLDTQEAIGKAVHWVLGYPGAFLITAGDMQVLPKILDAADRFEARPSDAEMATLAAEFAIQPVFA